MTNLHRNDRVGLGPFVSDHWIKGLDGKGARLSPGERSTLEDRLDRRSDPIDNFCHRLKDPRYGR